MPPVELDREFNVGLIEFAAEDAEAFNHLKRQGEDAVKHATETGHQNFSEY